jgi:hypothetical protein
VQAGDRVAERRQHPLHLVLSAFVDGQLEPRRAEAANPGGRRDAVVELDAVRETRERSLVRLALDLGLVDLVHLVARVHEPVRKPSVVRKEKNPGRVRVEAPNRHDAPLVADETDHGRPALGIARRRDDAGRLVQEDVRERLRRDLGAVHLDHVLPLHEGGEPGNFTVHRDTPGAYELLCSAARGDSGPGEVGVQAHRAIVPLSRAA